MVKDKAAGEYADNLDAAAPGRFHLHSHHGRAGHAGARRDDPRAAQAHHRIRRRRYFGSGGRRRDIRLLLGLDAIFVSARARRLVRPVRPPPDRVGQQFRSWARLYFHGAGAIAAVSVYRPADLRRHRRELLHRQRLCRRHHARGKARRALRHAWRGLRLWLHSGTGDRRRARQLRVAPAVLRRGGVKPPQCALRLFHPAGVALRGKARAKDRLARRQYFRRAETAGRPARTGHARGRGVPVLSGA